MLQLEKEFLNNYFSKLKIKACLAAGREIPNVKEKALFIRAKNYNSQGVS